MKKILLFIFCMNAIAGLASDSLFEYILIPQQAKLKTDASITLQLLKYSAGQNRYVADLENGMMVDKWLINGSIGVNTSSAQYGTLEGFNNFSSIKYHTPKEKPKENKVRISCEFKEGGKKYILFAEIEIDEFSNAFCIDPMNIDVGGTGMKQGACFYMERQDFKGTRNNAVNSLEKAPHYSNLTPAQKLQIAQLKAQQKMVNQSADAMDWMKNMSTGTAVFNTSCNTLIISISEPNSAEHKAISVIVPARKPGVYYTAYDKCLITCSGGTGCMGGAQGYISQYCKRNNQGECEPVVIPAVIRIESYGKEGELVTGYFTGKTGKVICEEIPQLHSIYGYFSVVRQPDIKVECSGEK